MRQKINENPVVQAALIGVLVLAVGFLMLTRVMGGSANNEAPPATESSATATPATGTTPAPAETTPSDTTPAPTPADPNATAPAPTDPATPAAEGEFVAGPGLPGDVVKAYADGKVVTLLVVRKNGTVDKQVKAMVDTLRSRSDTAVFVTAAAGIADFSRITQGLNVGRVPALVVIRPRRLTDGPTPVATVSYGFRGPQSIDQAVRDALYSGPDNQPYYPE